MNPYDDPQAAMDLGLAGMAVEIGVAPQEINAQWRGEVPPEHSTIEEPNQ